MSYLIFYISKLIKNSRRVHHYPTFPLFSQYFYFLFTLLLLNHIPFFKINGSRYFTHFFFSYFYFSFHTTFTQPSPFFSKLMGLATSPTFLSLFSLLYTYFLTSVFKPNVELAGTEGALPVSLSFLNIFFTA